jgi:hypothetical protein
LQSQPEQLHLLSFHLVPLPKDRKANPMLLQRFLVSNWAHWHPLPTLLSDWSELWFDF